ncbi:eukaryotic translation initiation factor 3 subunit M [Patella vulgata]|uniref:eukaryotic translation initiation factor 3 subunit M n=1 Tax=Patella vulgata TaxID=6465 RepID=UPI0021803519|nr:eukaryotic translation initiation factor 3 subunit M [Patella vulgata]
MSIPVIIDIAVPDQTAELRSFLKSSGAEISGENAEAGLLVDLKNIIEASDICWKELNSDADIEMVFNGVISLVLLLPPNEAESVVTLFCEKVGKAPATDKRINIRLKMLSNLFHGVEASSPLRYVVYLSLVRLAGQADMLSMAPTDLDEIKVWIAKWDISAQKVQTLLRTLHNALTLAKAINSTKVLIELLGTYTEDNASQAREDAHKCIVTCLADKDMFLMDHLLTLKPVKFLEGELIHDLLTIFVSGRLAQYQQFYKNNTDFVTSFLGLSHEDNLQKMRVLTFMQTVENRKEIDYSTIEKEMQIDEVDVEEFIINVLRTKTVQATIDQMQKKVIINWTTHRTFGKQQWQLLRQKLASWQTNLSNVEASLHSLAAMSQTPAS